MNELMRDRFVRAGATFGDDGPLHFGSVADEHRLLTEGAAMFDLSYRGEIVVTGDDRARFLHGQCTCDIEGTGPGRGVRGCFLTPKGKLEADAEFLVGDDQITVGTEKSAVAPIVERLQKFAVFDKVEIRDRSADRLLVSIQGPAAADHLSSIVTGDLPMIPFEHMITEVAGHRVRVTAIERIGTMGLELAVAEKGIEAILDLLEESFSWAGSEAFEIARIEAGVPRLGVDMGPDNLPPEARLDDTISYSKGCYVGQETIARLKTYGHVNRLLVGFEPGEGELPTAGTDLMVEAGGKPRGRITSRTDSPTLGPIAIGYAPREQTEPGSTLHTPNGGTVVVAELPFERSV